MFIFIVSYICLFEFKFIFIWINLAIMEAFEILSKLSLKELDEKCKSLRLKTYGDKKTRAKIILDHQKAETDRLLAEDFEFMFWFWLPT